MLQAEIEGEIDSNSIRPSPQIWRKLQEGCQPLLRSAIQQLLPTASPVPRPDQDTESRDQGREKRKKKKKSPSHKKPPIRLAIRGAGTSSKFQAQTEPSRAKQSYAPQPHRSALETFWRLGAIALTHVETVKKGIAWMLRRSYSC